MSLSGLWNGISNIFQQIGDFFVLIWDYISSGFELLVHYIDWMVKAVPMMFNFVTQGWNNISAVMVALPDVVSFAIAFVIVIPLFMLILKALAG